MKNREERLETVKNIIKTQQIPSQETLLEILNRNGFEVTQATLSRDLRQLRVTRVPDDAHGYFYVLPGDDTLKETKESFVRDISRGFISLAFSENLGVIKTIPGHAHSVAFALDNLEVPGILGTMAGDDTILIVIAEGWRQEDIKEELQKNIPSLNGYLT